MASRSAYLAELRASVQALSLTALHQEDTSVDWGEFSGAPGQQHYRLLGYVASQFRDRDIFDIGTHQGASALALSYEASNRVCSFDVKAADRALPRRPNVAYHVCDLWSPERRAEWAPRLLASAFIFLDVDPHEGTRELELVQWLREQRYAGFVICDDVWYFKPMRDRFWHQVPTADKLDVTDVGHWSGTGVVRFAPSQLWPALATPENWTVVTAYFDLTREPDASQPIRDRPPQHYLAHANATLAISQNLVVYCDPEYEAAFWALRPPHLHARTRVVPCGLADFPMTQHRAELEANRRKRPSADPRNTASYYLFCMARYAMVRRALDEDVFGSTRFAWCNVCIERMGWRNAAALDAVWDAQRAKVSTVWIDYIPRALVNDDPVYWLWGRCSFCSGFWTGDPASLRRFCERIEAKFLEYLRKGYGHADEQLYSPIYFEDPELFDWYLGDYTEMVTNYVEPRERSYQPVRLLLRNSVAAGDRVVAVRAAEKLLRAWTAGRTDLTPEQARELAGWAAATAIEH